MLHSDEYNFDSIDWENDRLDDYLEHAAKRDNLGMYLIHHAVRNNAPFSFIESIVAVLPDCLVLKDNTMKLPLHHAAQVGASERIIEYLVTHYHKGLRERDQVGMLPLHYLVGSCTSMKLFQLFERQYPESIREKDREGWLPLHHAARRSSSVEVLHFLVLKYPGGLSDNTYHGSLPIHCAAYYNRSLAVISFLTEQLPRGLKEGGTNGMRPIHSAARNNRLAVLEYFVNQYPLGLHVLDNQERLPIHYAIKNSDPMPVVSYLMNLYPEFVQKVDSNGWLPLHCAARSTSSIELIQYLIRLYPDALKIPDNQQWLPIFHAAKFNRSFEVIRYLYEQYPEAILHKLHDEIYCHEFAPVASNQRNFLGLQFMALDTGDVSVVNEVVRVHFVGDRQSGKTTMCNQMKEVLLESFNVGGLFDKPMESSTLLKSANIGTSTNTIMNTTTSSTSNIQSPNSYFVPSVKVKSANDSNRIIVKHSGDRYSHYLLFDYGGQAQYHVNHANFLSLPSSVYVITLPLFDKVNKHKYNLDFLLDRFFYWLKFLYSSAHSFTNYSSSALSRGTVKPVIAIAVVVNHFGSESKASVDEISGLRHVLLREAMTVFNIRTQQEYRQHYDLDPLYANDSTDFVLIGNEVFGVDITVRQNVRKVTEAVRRANVLLHLSPRSCIFSPFNPAYLPDTSAPFFGNRSHYAKDINPFFNLIKESKLISYCWDVLSLLDLSLVMLEEDFRLMLTSTIRTFFFKMLNYKDYKIKENLQSLVERELYQYMLNYFVFMGKVMVMRRRKTTLPPMKLAPAAMPPSCFPVKEKLHELEVPEVPSFPPVSSADLSTVGRGNFKEDASSSTSSKEDTQFRTVEETEIVHEPSDPPPPPPLVSGESEELHLNPYQSSSEDEEQEETDVVAEEDNITPEVGEEGEENRSDSGSDDSDSKDDLDYEGRYSSADEEDDSNPHSAEYEYVVITSPHLLMNSVLDALIDKLIVELRQNKKQLLLTPGELEAWLRDQHTLSSSSSLSPSFSLLELLVTAKVALPVYYNEAVNNQMIRLVHEDDLIDVQSLLATNPVSAPATTTAANRSITSPLRHLHQYYWLFQLSNDKIPEHLDVNYEFIATITNYNHLHQTELSTSIYREVARLFVFRHLRFSFFPGWFSALYVFLLAKIKSILHFNIYCDGLLIIAKDIGLIILPCVHRQEKPVSSSSSWSSAHGDHQHNAFVVKIVTSGMVNVENKNHYTNDIVWNLLNEFRYFMNAKLWNYEMQEFALPASTEVIRSFITRESSFARDPDGVEAGDVLIYPIEELEKLWFTRDRLEKRQFETLFGIHHPPYDQLYSSDVCNEASSAYSFFQHKLIYLMRATSPTTTSWYHEVAMITKQYSRDKYSEKVEVLISRVLLATKYSSLFRDGSSSARLSLQLMDEAIKEALVLLIVDYKRPQQVDNSLAVVTSNSTTRPNYHHLLSPCSSHYSILTRSEICEVLDKAIDLFLSLRDHTANQSLRKVEDFPLIPILSYCPSDDYDATLEERSSQVSSQAIESEEIVIKEDEEALTSRTTRGISRFALKNGGSGGTLVSESNSEPKASRKATFSTVKRSSSDRIHSFRVHFLCPVCGRRVNSGKDFRGYLVTVLGQWSESLLEVFVVTIKIFLYLTNIKPLAQNHATIPEIAFLLQDTLEILLSQIDAQFNPSLLASPSALSKLSIPPVVFYQMQKKIFYIMKNYSLKSYQQLRKLRESIGQVTKISLPKISLSLADPYNSGLLPPINTNHIPTPLTLTPQNDPWRNTLNLLGLNGGGAVSTASAAPTGGGGGSSSGGRVGTINQNHTTSSNINHNTASASAKVNGPNLGSNLQHILSEDDIHAIATSTSFSSVIQEIFRFTGSKDASQVLMREEMEKFLAMIPIDHDKYLGLLQNFFKAIDDEYLLHTGLMRVENNRGEVAWVCPPQLTSPSMSSSTAQTSTTTSSHSNHNISGGEAAPQLTLSDFNWNYSYQKDNPRFKSACADEFLSRGKRCLVYKMKEL